MAKYDSSYPELRTLPKMIAFLRGNLSDEEAQEIEKIIEEDDVYAYALERLDQAMLKGEEVEAVAAQFQDVFIGTIRNQKYREKLFYDSGGLIWQLR
jgi:flagellin-specific chaperone FliS